MPRFQFERPGRPDLAFEGELLAEVSTYEEGRERWLELRLYKTTSGKWVTESVGMSTVPGEVNFVRVGARNTPEQVLEALTRTNKTPGDALFGKKFLSDAAHDLLAEAEEKDPDLAGLLVEEV